MMTFTITLGWIVVALAAVVVVSLVLAFVFSETTGGAFAMEWPNGIGCAVSMIAFLLLLVALGIWIGAKA